MNKISKLVIVLIALILQGCAAATINKLAPDTYRAYSNSPDDVNVLSESNKYCERMGKEILVQVVRKNMVVFQCLNKNDRDLKRANYS